MNTVLGILFGGVITVQALRYYLHYYYPGFIPGDLELSIDTLLVLLAVPLGIMNLALLDIPTIMGAVKFAAPFILAA